MSKVLYITVAIMLTMSSAQALQAKRASEFLDSICVNTKRQQGQNLERVTAAVQYIGARCIRENAGASTADLLAMHLGTGARINLISGSRPQPGFLTLLTKARELASAGALLSVEGPNEPNNFAVTYDGETCGTGTTSWRCVAKLQRDLFSAWNSDHMLRDYPVIGVSEVGAEGSNAGLQWNKIPNSATGTDLPPGTVYSDIANVHNYACCYHLNGHTLTQDNVAWRAAALTQSPPFGGSWYNQHVKTWRRKYAGYTQVQSAGVPKVSTETGWRTDGTPEGDDLQARMIANIYLANFAQGWRQTFMYEAQDHSETGWGLYRAGAVWGPRPSADAMHRLTAWLQDSDNVFSPAGANIVFPNSSPYVHAVLLQKSTGEFELIVWGEKASGTVNQEIQLGAMYSRVRVYDPVTDAIEYDSATSSVTLTLGLGLKVIEFGN